MSLIVIKPGLMTSLQDQGRSGYAHLGVPNGGAMDKTAAQLANHLVDNAPESAVLEITAVGPTLKLDADCSIGIAGAEFNLSVDDQPISSNSSIDVKAGQILSFGSLKAGFRAYLACAGGFDVPSILGSRSMMSGGLVPGVSGRLLQASDVLALSAPRLVTGKSKYPWQILQAKRRYFVHAMPGPEADFFSSNQISSFFSQGFIITQDSNRIGYRLQGEIMLRKKTSIESVGVMPGSVQITPSGQPIVCLRDAQTTGGYPRIAVVHQQDLNVLAQARPGDEVWFSTHARS